MKLYNTLSKKVEEITSDDNHLGLYACGLTVYDFTHLGHLRKYTMDDVLIRALKYFKFDVDFVQNVTDVGHLSSDADTGEDKMEKGAKKYGETVWDVAKRFEDYFFYSMDTMGNLRPDISCRATEHIQEQLEMVKELEKKGFAYVIPGDGVYFDTSKQEDYGKLARLDLEAQKAGARVEVIEGKRNPSDFALWKFEKEGENRAMVWPSPWAERSYPGWHIECSAMAMKYLGDQFDIHTGGIDHIPVHHTNEIAQAEAATGKKPFVRYWVHHNHLMVEGEKMSKSLNNFFTIDDVLERGFHPKALRFFFLTTHYRSQLNFTWKNLAGMQQSLARIMPEIEEWRKNSKVPLDQLTDLAAKYVQQFFEQIADDLNTPEAVATFWLVVRDTQLSNAEKWTLIAEFDQVLGIGFADLQVADFKSSRKEAGLSELPEAAQKIAKLRIEARKEKDWAAADKYRDDLSALGVVVEDMPDGEKYFLSTED